MQHCHGGDWQSQQSSRALVQARDVLFFRPQMPPCGLQPRGLRHTPSAGDTLLASWQVTLPAPGRPLMVGLDLAMLSSLVAADRPEQTARRAVEVLTDLSLRGYPAQRALAVVERIEVREPAALDRLPALLDTIRRDQALSPAEAADALARGLAVTDSLQGAYRRAVEDERRKDNGKASSSAGSAADGPGNSENAPGRLLKVKQPPGQAKK